VDCILSLREEDKQNFISAYFRRGPTHRDGGLDLQNVVTSKLQSAVPGAAAYDKVDVHATFQRYTNANGSLNVRLSQHFPTEQAMVDWVSTAEILSLVISDLVPRL